MTCRLLLGRNLAEIEEFDRIAALVEAVLVDIEVQRRHERDVQTTEVQGAPQECERVHEVLKRVLRIHAFGKVT
jgi:hypothetical protein